MAEECFKIKACSTALQIENQLIKCSHGWRSSPTSCWRIFMTQLWIDFRRISPFVKFMFSFVLLHRHWAKHEKFLNLRAASFPIPCFLSVCAGLGHDKKYPLESRARRKSIRNETAKMKWNQARGFEMELFLITLFSAPNDSLSLFVSRKNLIFVVSWSLAPSLRIASHRLVKKMKRVT